MVASSTDIKKAKTAQPTKISGGNRVQKTVKPKKKSYLWVIKIQCLPFGFFEHELLGYFRQFGTVIRVRVARSTKTGNHKGWAFVGFDNKEVAEVAAETMNGYLMFNHRLIVRVMKPTTIPKSMLSGPALLPRPSMKGAARRDALRRNTTVGKSAEKRAAKRVSSLKKSNEKLKNLGIEYDLSTTPKPKTPIVENNKENGEIQVIETPKVAKKSVTIATPKTPAAKSPAVKKIEAVQKTPAFSPKTRAQKAAATPAKNSSVLSKAILKNAAASARPAALQKVEGKRGKKKSL